jgi:hypothetical protein
MVFWDFNELCRGRLVVLAHTMHRPAADIPRPYVGIGEYRQALAAYLIARQASGRSVTHSRQIGNSRSGLPRFVSSRDPRADYGAGARRLVDL